MAWSWSESNTKNKSQSWTAMEVDNDHALLSQLGGFALDQFLGDFTGDRSIKASGLTALGLREKGAERGGRGVEASQIYSERYADDDDDEQRADFGGRRDGGDGELPAGGRGFEDAGDDWEDEIDRERTR